MKMRNFLVLATLVLGVFTISCSNDDDNGPATASIQVTLVNLLPIQGAAQYQAWLKVNGSDVSLGTFQDAIFPKTFTALADIVASADEFFITLESLGNNNVPSDTRIANAVFNDTSNKAQVNSSQTIGDFDTISGSFVLRTFTNIVPNNNPNGIWFTGTLGTNITPGLSLPLLPNGWQYESWVVIQDRNGTDVNLSLGKFSDVNQADSSDIFSGDISGPTIPGEDFLNQAAGNLINVDIPVNLVGKRGFITVEPTTADNSSEPFYIQVLSFNTALDNQVNTMNTNNFFITGSVERSVTQ